MRLPCQFEQIIICLDQVNFICCGFRVVAAAAAVAI